MSEKFLTTRRALLQSTAAAGLVAATSVPVASRAPRKTALARIKSVIRRDETILQLGGNGDDFLMTWAADDRQFVAVQDGAGWFKPPQGEYNSRLWAVSGSPQEALFQDVDGYPELLNVLHTENIARYYGFGTLALDGYIYQFLSTLTGPLSRGAEEWIGAKLIYSPDNGRTWHNQDGSTPVVWEPWQRRSRENMVFFREPQNAFSLLAILQMGRNYADNRDGYLYVYSPNGMTNGTMNQVVLFRVAKNQLLQRNAYEYFAGLKPNGEASWSSHIEARAVVHTFPRGWVNTPSPVECWYPSVVYNAPLGVYMMANWGVGCGPDGSPWKKPSYLGLWIAYHPWGPWTQVHEETVWTPRNDSAARCYVPQIAPKWIAADGKSFWLVWTDYQYKNTSECQQGQNELAQALVPDPRKRAASQEEDRRLQAFMASCQPYYAFNTQRVDLVMA